MSRLTTLQFITGLGIFVYGLDFLEDVINSSSAETIKRRIKKGTSSLFKSTWLGVLITAITQSSTIVSVMTLAFVGAGLMSLLNAVGVIVGANVGSAFLPILFAFIGFNFEIKHYALAMIGIGGLVSRFVKNRTIVAISLATMALGLLFFGLGEMKTAVSFLQHINEYSWFQYLSGASYVWYFLFGVIFTAVLQSSGMMTGITMAFVGAGIFTMEQAVAIILGSNIGTTFTALWSSWKGVAVKRQVARSHFAFNLVTSVASLPFVGWLSGLTVMMAKSPFPGSTQAMGLETGLAMFQLIYNVIGAILIYPFIPWFARKLTERIPGEKSDYQLLSIENPTDQMYQQDVLVLLKKIFKFNVHQLDIDQKVLLDKNKILRQKQKATYVVSDEDLKEDYEILRTIEEDITESLLTNQSRTDIQRQRWYESIQQMMMSAWTLKEKRNNYIRLSKSGDAAIVQEIQRLKNKMIDIYLLISQLIDNPDDKALAKELDNLMLKAQQDELELTSTLGTRLSVSDLEKGLLGDLLHLETALDQSYEWMIGAAKKTVE